MRRRSPWEAADAGLILWREHFVWFLPFFALPLWLTAFGFRLLPFSTRPWSYLFLWWMKPFFDRPLLHIIAVRFFEPRSPGRRFFRGLGTSLSRGLAGDLLWRRFSPWRPGYMPIRVLENCKFSELKRRKRTLERGGINFCVFITGLGLALETALLGGEVLFSLTMTELLRPDILPFLQQYFAEFEVCVFAAYCVNYILIESLTVSMGFGIYINSRVEAEGWDLEILLRQFAESHAKTLVSPPIQRPGSPLPDNREEHQPGPLKVPAGSSLLLCLVLALFPLKGYAEGAEAAEMSGAARFGSFEEVFDGNDGEAPEELLREILRSPDFGEKRESWGLRFKQWEYEPSLDYPPAGRIEAIKRGFAYVLRFCVIFALGGFAVFILLRRQKFHRKPALPKNGTSRESLTPPQDDPRFLLARAELCQSHGRHREAWALCFGGAIAAYNRYRGIRFPPGATEYECLSLVRSAATEASPGKGDPGEAEGFAALVFCRVSQAYGGTIPDPGAFKSSLAFCRSLLPAGRGEPGGTRG
jgi:hypothetical protein